MTVTRLKRKVKRRRSAAETRKQTIKVLSKKAPVKNVDVEELKKEFNK